MNISITNQFGVKKEKHGYRDARYNDRHRTYGPRLTRVDMDCIVGDKLEAFGGDCDFLYSDNQKSCAPIMLIEEKHGACGTIDLSAFQMKTLRYSADIQKIPFYILVYFPTGKDLSTDQIDRYGAHWFFYCIPGNNLAIEKLGGKPRYLSEDEWVCFLWSHYFDKKGNPMNPPAYIRKNLDKEKPNQKIFNSVWKPRIVR